jgi:hypothetical protein
MISWENINKDWEEWEEVILKVAKGEINERKDTTNSNSYIDSYANY